MGDARGTPRALNPSAEILPSESGTEGTAGGVGQEVFRPARVGVLPYGLGDVPGPKRGFAA